MKMTALYQTGTANLGTATAFLSNFLRETNTGVKQHVICIWLCAYAVSFDIRLLHVQMHCYNDGLAFFLYISLNICVVGVDINEVCNLC
jgi:hypothetical protein